MCPSPDACSLLTPERALLEGVNAKCGSCQANFLNANGRK